MIGVCSKITCEYFRGYSYCTAPDGCVYTTDPSYIKKAVEIASELKTQTNADRIRAMTDEELAERMSGLESFALTCGGGWPREKWLDWLRQEVDG